MTGSNGWQKITVLGDKMFIICGDSWASGEWALVDKNMPSYTTHKGLSQYLEEDGHEVVNISIGGSSNIETSVALRTALNVLTQSNKLDPATATIILFQTEWFRDIGTQPHVTRYPNVIEPLSQELINKTISFWQYDLVALAKEYNVKIHLVGGASDTMWLSQFDQEYPGLTILCQSLTNLCTNDNSRIDRPIFGIRYPENFVKILKPLCVNDQDLKFLIEELDQTNARNKIFKEHPEYFWPDGLHANRKAHYKLYKYIKERLSL